MTNFLGNVEIFQETPKKGRSKISAKIWPPVSEVLDPLVPPCDPPAQNLGGRDPSTPRIDAYALALPNLRIYNYNCTIAILQLQITFYNCRNCHQLHVKICPDKVHNWSTKGLRNIY